MKVYGLRIKVLCIESSGLRGQGLNCWSRSELLVSDEPLPGQLRVPLYMLGYRLLDHLVARLVVWGL